MKRRRGAERQTQKRKTIELDGNGSSDRSKEQEEFEDESGGIIKSFNRFMSPLRTLKERWVTVAVTCLLVLLSIVGVIFLEGRDTPVSAFIKIAAGNTEVMNNFRAVFVTTPSVEVAKKIAHGLVTNKLAACVNIIPQITSVYEWEGKINEDSEQLLMIKTQSDKVDQIDKFVKENHPYDVPEVIAVPIEQGSEKYLQWVKDTYKSDDGEITLKNLSEVRDLKTLEKGKPHEGSKCSFRTLNLLDLSTEHDETKTDRGIPLAASIYCPSLPSLDPTTDSSDCITATIGITGVSEFDRLLEVCLTRLREGETGTFEVKCSTSNSSYELTLQLVSIEESLEQYELNCEKVIEIASSLKEEGVRLFQANFVIDAFFKFSKGIKYLYLLDPSMRNEAYNNLVVVLQNNMAGCHIKLENWDQVIDLCNEVLKEDSENVKALYRRGCSYTELQEYEKAGEDLEKAKMLDPQSQAIKAKLTVLEEKTKALNAKYAEAMKKFFK